MRTTFSAESNNGLNGLNRLHLHHAIPLDFHSVETLPDSHIWPKSGDPEHSDDLSCIPLIDLRYPDAADQIEQACATWGVFQVTNHGVPLKLLQEVESEARSLFSLPLGQKLKALRSPSSIAGYGIAQISPFFNKCMWHEGFTIKGSPVDHARRLWPHNYRSFCEVIEDYQKRMKELAQTLVQIILKSLGVSEEEINWIRSTLTEDATTALQLNSYPLCPEPNRAMGLAPHMDTSLVTILHQSATSKGLQMFKEGVGWVGVCPVNGALVVNVGDFLHILSNARFPSVLHRVVMKEAKQRLSVAFFYSPPSEFLVSPLVLNSGQIPKYRSISVGDYVRIKASNPETALSLIRI